MLIHNKKAKLNSLSFIPTVVVMEVIDQAEQQSIEEIRGKMVTEDLYREVSEHHTVQNE